MSEFSEQEHLVDDQYRDATNFAARLNVLQDISTAPIDWYRWLFEHVSLPVDARVLEIGCGPGYFWQRNLDRIPADWQITLSDLSPGMLENARQNLPQDQQQWHFEIVDAQSIPFAASSYDAVIANAMLYHVPDRQKAFAEICRVLQPGGFFYATTLDRNSFIDIAPLLSLVTDINNFGSFEFHLDNAYDELSPWFASIEVHGHIESLVFSEADQLMTFVLSLTARLQRTEEHLQALRRGAENLLKEGPLEVPMKFALFICH